MAKSSEIPKRAMPFLRRQATGQRHSTSRGCMTPPAASTLPLKTIDSVAMGKKYIVFINVYNGDYNMIIKQPIKLNPIKITLNHY